jgi:predicted MFS family arabinose efflux permease
MRNHWIVIALIVCVFANTTGEFVIAGILPAIADDLRVSISDAGLLVTAYAIGMIVGGPLLTALTVRFARKPLIVWLLAIAAIGNVASAAAPNYAALFTARIFTSLVTSTFFANAVVIAASTAPAGKQASTVSKLAFGMNLSMILGAPIGTFIGNHAGGGPPSWRSPCAVPSDGSWWSVWSRTSRANLPELPSGRNGVFSAAPMCCSRSPSPRLATPDNLPSLLICRRF